MKNIIFIFFLKNYEPTSAHKPLGSLFWGPWDLYIFWDPGILILGPLGSLFWDPGIHILGPWDPYFGTPGILILAPWDPYFGTTGRLILGPWDASHVYDVYYVDLPIL